MRFLIPLVFGAMVMGHGQKLVQKRLLNPFTKTITVDTNNCYQVWINTAPTEELRIEAAFEGEYQKDLVVNVREDGDNALVNAGFNPNFRHPNDKLSAHKVISIELHLTVPEYVNVQVVGTSTTIVATGDYGNFSVVLSDGDCYMKRMSGQVMVRTQSGNIELRAKAGKIVAESTYGQINLESMEPSDDLYELKSVQGNIVVNHTE